MSGIEFLDEVADRPADQTARGSRRWWLLGGLVLALVIIWALIRPVEHPRSMPEAVPTHVPLATASPLATATPLAPEEDLCRQEPNCARTTVVPLVLREVINRYVPRRESITVQSYLTKSIFDGATYLVARRIDMVAGPATVGILILRDVQANRRPLPPLTTPYGVAPILVRGDPFGYVVSLQYLGPLNASQSVARLRALAAEPGLESL
jgi:hypothetical protein